MAEITRRRFLAVSAGSAAGLMAGTVGWAGGPEHKLNVLLITADDMNWDTPGCFGSKVPDITPNIDRLAREGMRFSRAHVTCAVCMPSREVLMTGRYPHHNGGEGFEPIREDVPTLQEQLKKAGYLNGILGKTNHLMPASKFPWDLRYTQGDLGYGRDPKIYAERAKELFDKARAEGKPFFLMANSHDPHRPFHGSEQEKNSFGEAAASITKPSRVYSPEEVRVPGFLPDIPDVRKEIAQYYSSARRCDDTVGAVLRALKESGQEENTLVMFLSDNGMALPFAKTNCYLNSTCTPWIVRWPGHVKPGSTESAHFVSGIDYMPTILDALGLPKPEEMDGASFVPLLSGQEQKGRDRVFTVFHETAGKVRFEMRCVQDGRLGYIYNAWSDGKTIFRNESQSGLTMAAMYKAAESDKQIAARVKLFLYRVPEELYDFEKDPDALHNLAGDQAYRADLTRMRKELLDWMKRTGDPILPKYRSLVG